MDKMQNHYETNDINKDVITSSIVSYVNYIDNKNMHFQIWDKSGKKIYDDFKMNTNKIKSEVNIDEGKVGYEIIKIKDKNYLYVNKKISIYSDYYKIAYIKEISWVYENYRYLYGILIKED